MLDVSLLGWVLGLLAVLGESSPSSNDRASFVDTYADESSPLYNAELAAPEMRGLLVSFYQLATILGIMLSFWYVQDLP